MFNSKEKVIDGFACRNIPDSMIFLEKPEWRAKKGYHSILLIQIVKIGKKNATSYVAPSLWTSALKLMKVSEDIHAEPLP